MLFPLRPASKLIFLQSIMCDVFGVWEAPPGCNVMADRVTECARCGWCAPGAEVLLCRSARWMVTRSLWWQPRESPTRKALCLLRWPPETWAESAAWVKRDGAHCRFLFWPSHHISGESPAEAPALRWLPPFTSGALPLPRPLQLDLLCFISFGLSMPNESRSNLLESLSDRRSLAVSFYIVQNRTPAVAAQSLNNIILVT